MIFSIHFQSPNIPRCTGDLNKSQKSKFSQKNAKQAKIPCLLKERKFEMY